jgi:predicted nuclease of predicted toxin-antitoxin system
VRFLIDQCLSPDLASDLTAAGHDVIHLRQLGLQRAKDPEVLHVARQQHRVLLSADTDFGTLLAQSAATDPSVIIFRRLTGRHPAQQAALLLVNLPEITEALDQGSIIVIEETRIRVRRLPVND